MKFFNKWNYGFQNLQFFSMQITFFFNHDLILRLFLLNQIIVFVYSERIIPA